MVSANQGPYLFGGRTMLPSITTALTIEGVGNAGIYSDGSNARLAYVEPGARLTLRNTTVAGFGIRGRASTVEPCDPCSAPIRQL